MMNGLTCRHPRFAAYWRTSTGTKEKSTPSEDLQAINRWLYTDLSLGKPKSHPRHTWMAVGNRAKQLAERVLANLESEQKAPNAYRFFTELKALAEKMQARFLKDRWAEYKSDFHGALHRPMTAMLEKLDRIEPALDLKGYPEAFEQIFNQAFKTGRSGR